MNNIHINMGPILIWARFKLRLPKTPSHYIVSMTECTQNQISESKYSPQLVLGRVLDWAWWLAFLQSFPPEFKSDQNPLINIHLISWTQFWDWAKSEMTFMIWPMIRNIKIFTSTRFGSSSSVLLLFADFAIWVVINTDWSFHTNHGWTLDHLFYLVDFAN